MGSPLPASQEAELRREVDVDRARIVYTDAGSGDPLLLLHGYPQSRLAWRHQLPALPRTHGVLAPDWLGWGESGRPRPNCPPWIARELAERIPGVRLDRLSGADHYVMEARPGEVLAALQAWLAR